MLKPVLGPLPPSTALPMPVHVTLGARDRLLDSPGPRPPPPAPGPRATVHLLSEQGHLLEELAEPTLTALLAVLS